MFSTKSKTTSSFLGDVMTITVGTAIAQLIGVATTPVLTRIFSVEAFGLLGLFVSMTHIGEVIACLRYESSIMLPATDEEAANQLAVSLCVALIISGIIFWILWVSKYWVANILKSPDLVPFIPWIALAVLVSGLLAALNSWNTRTKNYYRLATAKVLNTGGASISQLLLGLAGLSRGGNLITGNIFGLAISSLFLAVKIWIDHSLFFINNVRLSKMIAGMNRYRKFPLWSSWSSLLNITSLQLPSLLLAAFFSPVVVGYYLLGHRVLRMPISLIGNSIAQVFYQRASQATLSGQLPDLVFNIASRLIAFGLLPILLLTVAGRELFIFIFGGEWGEAGLYMQILSIWTFFVFIGNPISSLTNVLEKQEASLVFNVVLIISRVASLVIGGLLENIYLALILFSASGVSAWSIFTIWLLHQSKVSLKRVFIQILNYFAFSLPFVISIIWLKTSIIDNPLLISLLCTASIIVYYGIIIYRDKTIQKFLLSYVIKLGVVKSPNIN